MPRGRAARRVVERSTAIKCPDIGHHLAGTKKVQQVLCDPARLRRSAFRRSCADGIFVVPRTLVIGITLAFFFFALNPRGFRLICVLGVYTTFSSAKAFLHFPRLGIYFHMFIHATAFFKK